MGLESLIVSHHSAKFGGHKHCGKGDEMFLVVQEEDSICFCNYNGCNSTCGL